MAIADAQGLVRLDGLPSGRYSLSLMNIALGGSAPSDYFSDPTIFEVLDGDVEMVEVRAKRGATISGVAVIEGANDPSLQSKLGELQVSAFSRPTTPTSGGMPSFGSNFKINRDGSFRLGGLQTGKVQFNLMTGRTPTGFSIARVEVDGVPQRDGVEVAAGQQVNNVRLVLVYGQGVVRGQVQIVGGQLPEGARLVVMARRVDSPTPNSGPPAQVDARGQFVIQGLAAGEYELTLNASPRMAVTMTMSSTNSGGAPGAPVSGGATIITSTTVPPPPPAGTTPTGAPAFTPKTVKQKVMVPGTGEVPVAMTLDLTPAPRGN
jgi:hypothetical protein